MSSNLTSIGDTAFLNCKVNVFDLMLCTPVFFARTFESNLVNPVNVYLNPQTTIPTGSVNVVYQVYSTNPDGTYTFSKYVGTKTSITLSDTVSIIGASAFYNTPITSITLPNITAIHDYAFYGCGLTSLVLPNSVKFVGKKAFYNTGLSSVTAPTLSYVGKDAFRPEIRMFIQTIPYELVRYTIDLI